MKGLRSFSSQVKLKKPHETRSLLKSSISKIEVDKSVFGLASFGEIEKTYKEFCEKNAEK